VKKIGRKLLIPGVVLISLILLVVLGATIFLPTEKISQQVETELEKATGAQVSVGDSGIQWWPHLGVTLKNCTIKGQGSELARAAGSPNELGEYSITLKHFGLKVALKPLLGKEVQVEAIRLSGMDLDAVFQDKKYILKNTDLSVTDLKISMAAASTAGKKAPAAGKIAVGEMIPEELVLAFQGQAQSVDAQGLLLEDVQFFGGLDARVLTVESITARVGEGTIEGNLEIDYERNPDGFLDFEAVAAAVKAGSLLGPWAPGLGDKLEAELNGSVRGNCLLGEQDVVSRSLTVNGNIGSGAGILRARQWLGTIAPYLGQRQDLLDIRFNSFSHILRLEKGRYLVESLEIDGIDTQWHSNGSLGLDGTIDLDVKVKLPAGFTPELGQWSFLAETLRDKDGRVNLDFSLTGETVKPQVGLNLGSLQDMAGEETEGALKKGLGGLLDKWKNR